MTTPEPPASASGRPLPDAPATHRNREPIREELARWLTESARVARRYVIIAEDVLDRRASRSVVDSYRAHDPWAVYRSTNEWVALARGRGLVLERIVALDRVPLHVAREARPRCTLDYPPMQYMVFRAVMHPARGV